MQLVWWVTGGWGLALHAQQANTQSLLLLQLIRLQPPAATTLLQVSQRLFLSPGFACNQGQTGQLTLACVLCVGLRRRQQPETPSRHVGCS